MPRETRRDPSSLGARFGLQSATQRALGVTPSELAVLVAVASCERAEGGYPTREAIWAVVGSGRTNLASQLCARGLLRQVDRTSERLAVYGLTERARELLGLAGEGVAA